MADNADKITWWKTSDTTWETVTSKRGYTAEITIGAKPDPYTIEINPGAITTSHETFRQAKNEFRKFLFNKPV